MESSLDGWVDFCLIPDATCSYVLNDYRRKRGLPCFDVIAVDRDLARMWNLPVKDAGPREQRHPLEETHPFWMDDQSFVHILPDDLVTVKRTKDLDMSCGQKIDLRTPEQRTIRLILAEQIDDVLRVKPNVRILLIDQFETFLNPASMNKFQIEFAFTSAPPFGLLNGDQENEFYERLRKIQLSRNIETREVDRNTDRKEETRCAYIMWRGFVPNYEHFDRETDVRWLDVHLNDSNDSLFWRDLISNILENEYVVSKAGDQKDARKIALVIRMRISDSIKVPKEYERLAVLRRVKRFGAFFSRVYEIIDRNNLQHTPKIFWTCPTSERDYVYDAYSDLLREYIIGLRENIRPYDRFLHVENLRDAIGSHCAITPEPFAHDANILGVCNETLIGGDAIFPQTVYGLGGSGTYMSKSECGAPIYKLREYEV